MENNITPDAGWRNLDAGNADYGATPPGESFKHNASLVRESVQNSIDARADDKRPVVVDFELLRFSGNSLPDFVGYKQRMQERTLERGRVQNSRWLDSMESVVNEGRSNWWVLRIGDHNTTGLDYDPNNNSGCTWHKLVRAQNSSSKRNQEGGSFGLGSGAHCVGSVLYQVFYGAMSQKSGEYRFQGVAHLGSISQPGTAGRFFDSRIFYGTGKGGWTPCTLAPLGFVQRKPGDNGTDVYIVAPRALESSGDGFGEPQKHSEALLRFIWQFVYNFAPAIKSGTVAARFLQDGTLYREIKNAGQAAAFIKDLLDASRESEEPSPAFSLEGKNYEQAAAQFLFKYFLNELPVEKVELNGRVVAQLSFQIGKEAENVVYAARKVGMRVERPWAPFRGVGRYSYLVDVSDDMANRELRMLETPDHLTWTADVTADVDSAVILQKKLRRAVRSLIDAAQKESVASDEMPITDLGALISTTSGGENVQTDLMLRPVAISKTAADPRPYLGSTNPAKRKKGKGTKSTPNPKRERSKTKRDDFIGDQGGTQEVLLASPVQDRILAVDPVAGIYVLKFTVPEEYSRIRLALHFTPDDAARNSLEEKDATKLYVEELLDAAGCTASVSARGCIELSDVSIENKVKLKVRLREKRMSGIRVQYYGTK